MQFLLDTHVLIALIEEEPGRFGQPIASALLAPDASLSVSVASLWEIAIKTRMGKLGLSTRLDLLPDLINAMRLDLLPIVARHVLENVAPEPPTRDPFDRLLLAQCIVEGMRLVTVDGALMGHPMAFAPG